jgi:hypothetical protein
LSRRYRWSGAAPLRKSRPQVSTLPSSVSCRRRNFRSQAAFAEGSRLRRTSPVWAVVAIGAGHASRNLHHPPYSPISTPNSTACLSEGGGLAFNNPFAPPRRWRSFRQSTNSGRATVTSYLGAAFCILSAHLLHRPDKAGADYDHPRIMNCAQGCWDVSASTLGSATPAVAIETDDYAGAIGTQRCSNSHWSGRGAARRRP